MNTNHRRKMCEHCAFRKSSVEMNVPMQKEYLLGECLHRVFFCHETMYQNNQGETKWLGSFDPARRRDGSAAKSGDHQICAGFALAFGEEIGIDATDIPTEDHAIIGGKMKRL